MTTIKQMAEDHVAIRYPELKGRLKQNAIRGYIDGYKSAPHPIIQPEINFDWDENNFTRISIRS